MSDASIEAAASLARMHMVQLRLTGILLDVLVQRGIIPKGGVPATIEDAASYLMPGPDDAFLEAMSQLADEFR